MPVWAQAGHSLTGRQVGEGGAAKFYPDGRVHRFAGNTIICHLPQQGRASQPFHEMLDIYREAPWRPYGQRIAFLPPSSYHMTILGGAIEIDRSEGKWPEGIPSDASIEECNRIVGERIRASKIERLCAVRMKVDLSDSGYDGNTIRIPLEPVNCEELNRLEEFRSLLAEAIGISQPSQGSYQFHMTLGYLLAPLESSELKLALADLDTWKKRIIEAAPVIQFGTPEYCTFEDMFAFERQFFVGSEA